MKEQAANDTIFSVGLCMAGAVSAGAYTAGVMDYLLEALQEWQRRKDEGIADTPSHVVQIPVIGGASAGGMTGIITGSAINNPISNVPMTEKSDFTPHPENKFYHTWVDLVADDMFPLMLQTDDIREGGGIRSLLNSNFIDAIARRVIEVDKTKWQSLAPWWKQPLKIFTTMTNLQGYCYNVGFKASIRDSEYFMTIHNDYACFAMSDDASNIAEPHWMPLDFKAGTNANIAGDAAMATGAFPIGLLARPIERSLNVINTNPWLLEQTRGIPLTDPVVKTLNVDGGLINNEPFDKVRSVLNDVTGQTDCKEYENYNKFKSTILMIDPFPSEPPAAWKPDQNVFKVVGFTLSAMIDQMRAKPAHLVDAMDSNNAGQYLIAPSRRRPRLDGKEEDIQGCKAIACGAFDGFSGFINKEFRIHDFYLGRFNCEMFLRNYFTVPASALENNPIFRDGYNGVDKSKFQAKDGSFPIIPVFTPQSKFALPVFSSGSNWPVMKESEIDRYRPAVSRRVEALIMNFAKLKWYNRILLKMGSILLLNRVLTNKAMTAIKQSLLAHQLLKEGE